MKPLAVQLYSVRELCKEDFPGTLKKIADIGFKGVEFAGFHNMSPKDLKACLADLGLQVASSHMPMPNDENAAELIDQCQTLGITKLITGPGGPIDTTEHVMACVERQKRAVSLLKGTGISFGLHNHWLEFRAVEGAFPEDTMLQQVDGLIAELDVYWIQVGGPDPVKTVARLKDRAPLLHIKDGLIDPPQPMKPIGQGVLDMPAIIGAADPDILDWLIVELDSCDRDMLTALEESYQYLVSNGLAAGNKAV